MTSVQRLSLRTVLVAFFAMGCQQAFAECGTASYYWQGKVTANGERYNHLGISAAHKSLPFGTMVRVTHQRTGRSILVRINDRGPFVAGRIIDLSTGAKQALGMDGLAPVCIQAVGRGSAPVRHAVLRIKKPQRARRAVRAPRSWQPASAIRTISAKPSRHRVKSRNYKRRLHNFEQA